MASSQGETVTQSFAAAAAPAAAARSNGRITKKRSAAVIYEIAQAKRKIAALHKLNEIENIC
jgi:hypothetical protein